MDELGSPANRGSAVLILDKRGGESMKRASRVK